MEKKKVCFIEAALCDTRKVQEEMLSAYEKVVIEAAILIVTPKSKTLLDQYAVAVESHNVLELDEDVMFSTMNGSVDIKPGQMADHAPVFLMVNGSLTIAPGSEEILKHYAGLCVNGSVTCPESLSHCITSINGTLATYPDGCIRLKNHTVLDSMFHLRAKEGARYYASRSVTALDEGIRFDWLAEKQVSFITRKLLVYEKLAEIAAPLFSEETDIVILPDGCACVNDDAVLDEDLYVRCGSKLYIDGDLIIKSDSGPWLERLSFLYVNGDILTVRSQAEALRRLKPRCDNVQIIGGLLFENSQNLAIHRTTLEEATDGLSLSGCVGVTFDEDIPAELLRERLVTVSGCVNIQCTPAQRTVIESIAKDTIFDSDRPKEKKIDKNLEACAKALGLTDLSPEEWAKLRQECRFVSSAMYTM